LKSAHQFQSIQVFVGVYMSNLEVNHPTYHPTFYPTYHPTDRCLTTFLTTCLTTPPLINAQTSYFANLPITPIICLTTSLTTCLTTCLTTIFYTIIYLLTKGFPVRRRKLNFQHKIVQLIFRSRIPSRFHFAEQSINAFAKFLDKIVFVHILRDFRVSRKVNSANDPVFKLLQNEVKLCNFSSRYLMHVDMSDFDRAAAQYSAKLEVAKKMLEANEPIQKIVEFTGLPEGEIRKL